MPENVAGLLLAGGQSRRMGGGDKALMKLGGETLLDRIIARVRPQIGGPLVLNANGDPLRFEGFGLPIAPDVVEGYAGPLAGVLTGLEWTREHAPECQYVASFACDAPFVPRDLVRRLSLAVFEGAEMACATSGGREHPVFALWPVRLAGDLRRAVVEEGVRKVDAWTARYRLARVAFSTDPVDPFFNVNAPEDMAAAETLL